MGSQENFFGSVIWSIGKIIILSFRVGTSKNKNISHRNISLHRDSTESSAQNFLYLFHSNVKEKDRIIRKVSSQKMFICEFGIDILICQKVWSVRPIQQKVKLPSPKVLFAMK